MSLTRRIQYSKIQKRFYFFSPAEQNVYFWDERQTQLAFQVEFDGFNAVQPKVTHFSDTDFKKDSRAWQRLVKQSRRQHDEKFRRGRNVRTMRGVRRLIEESMNKNVDICLEIEHLRVFLVATCDCRFGLVDAVDFRVLMKVQLDIKRIQHILFSGSHQTIVLVNHSNNIPLFLLSLRDNEFEIEFVCNLIGHLAILVTATLIEDKGFLISVDEANVVKVWNLTLKRCVQTLELATKFPVSSLIFQEDLFRLALISKKINQYELTVINDEKPDAVEDVILDFHFDPLAKKIFVFKSSCVLTIDSDNGRVRNIKHYSSSPDALSEPAQPAPQPRLDQPSSTTTLPSVNFSALPQAKSAKELNKKVRLLNRQTVLEEQQRRQVKNRVNNFAARKRAGSDLTLGSVNSTPRFAPRKSKLRDENAGLNDLYSWTNYASCIRVINHGHHLAMGTFSGKAQIDSLNRSESKALRAHSSKVLNIDYDFQHHLCLSVSSSLLRIQKESSQGYQSIRELRLKNFPQEPSLVRLSVHLNMIIFVCSFNQIFVVDYEFLRMFARLYVPCISIPSPRGQKDSDLEHNSCQLNLR